MAFYADLLGLGLLLLDLGVKEEALLLELALLFNHAVKLLLAGKQRVDVNQLRPLVLLPLGSHGTTVCFGRLSLQRFRCFRLHFYFRQDGMGLKKLLFIALEAHEIADPGRVVKTLVRLMVARWTLLKIVALFVEAVRLLGRLSVL